MAEFFIDPTGGLDANPGTVGSPWQTLAKYATVEVRSPGDIATCRNGSSDNLGAADLDFDEDGEANNPIIVEADYDNAFGDDVDLSATATATLVAGSKAILWSADISAVLALGDVIYVAIEDSREFSYEVAIVQAADSGTDDGADSNKLIDTGKFASTVLGTQIVNTTDGITGYVSELVSANEVEVTLDGRPSGLGGTIVVFDNGDTFTIAHQSVLFLPYKGDQAGAGKAMTNIQSPPLWNTIGGDFKWNLNLTNYWYFQGLHPRGTDSSGIADFNSNSGIIFKDFIFEGDGTTVTCLRVSDDQPDVQVLKTRFFNYTDAYTSNVGQGAIVGLFRDCLFDGNSAADSVALTVNRWTLIEVHDSEFRNHATADVEMVSFSGGSTLKFRNVLLTSGTPILDVEDGEDGEFNRVLTEDYGGTPSDTRRFSYQDSAAATPILRSDTSKLRSGGSNISIKVTPSTKLGTVWEMSRVKLFDLAFFATTDEKTYTVFFASDDNVDWTVDPTTLELWIEADFWTDGTFKQRRIVKSTGTMDFSTDTDFDQSLAVTITPSQAGVLYLRAYYAKPKEAGNDNIFYCDPIPAVT